MEGSHHDRPRDAFDSLGLGVTSWSSYLRHITETFLANIDDNNDHDDDVPAREAQMQRRNGQQHDGNGTRTGEEGDATESLSISTIDDLMEDDSDEKFQQLSLFIDPLDSSTIPSLDDSYVMIDDDNNEDNDENDDGNDLAMNPSHHQDKHKERKQEERESDSLPFPIVFVTWQ